MKPIKIIEYKKTSITDTEIEWLVKYRDGINFGTFTALYKNSCLTIKEPTDVDKKILLVSALRLCSDIQKEHNKYYRFLTLEEWDLFMSGLEIPNPTFYGKLSAFISANDSKGGVRIALAIDLFNWGMINTDNYLLVEFVPVDDDLQFKKTTGTCTDPFNDKTKVAINQYSLPSYSNKVLKAVRAINIEAAILSNKIISEKDDWVSLEDEYET